jgi:hypothetical protein
MRETKPLYRRVNTRARGVRHGFGGDYRHERNTKAEKASEATRGSMHGTQRRGLDYTPLFRFLLSKLGEDWDAVHSEAVARLDRPDPIFWLVALRPEDEKPVVRVGESTFWSGLRVDADGRLAPVDPALRAADMAPSCPCCTHTFNGERFGRKWGE